MTDIESVTNYGNAEKYIIFDIKFEITKNVEISLSFLKLFCWFCIWKLYKNF